MPPRIALILTVAALLGTDSPDPTAADGVFVTIDRALARVEADGALDRTIPGWRLAMPEPPFVTFTEGSTYLWHLDTTKGTLNIRLRPDVAPRHVASTIHLTRAGYYDGLGFHRVLGGFMAQGGCPLGTGTGDPGYFIDGEVDDAVRHDRPGIVSAANAGDGTDGSQFFLTFAPAATLDGVYTVFGEVIDGELTLRAIERCAQSREQMQRTYSEAPLDPITIRAATVTVEGP